MDIKMKYIDNKAAHGNIKHGIVGAARHGRVLGAEAPRDGGGSGRRASGCSEGVR
jgi:hypothetical protein